MALSAEPVDMDPANSGGTPTAAAEQLIYNTLVRNTPEQTVNLLGDGLRDALDPRMRT